MKSVSLFARVYAGAVLGLLMSLGLSRVVWLEMRIKTGLLIPLCAAAFVVLWNRSGRFATLRLVLALQVALGVLFLMAGGWDPVCLEVLPSALVRDGLGLSGVSLATLNWWLLAGVALGNLALAWAGPGRRPAVM